MTKITFSNHQIARTGQSYELIGPSFWMNMKCNPLVAPKSSAVNRTVNRYVSIFPAINRFSGEIYEYRN